MSFLRMSDLILALLVASGAPAPTFSVQAGWRLSQSLAALDRSAARTGALSHWSRDVRERIGLPVEVYTREGETTLVAASEALIRLQTDGYLSRTGRGTRVQLLPTDRATTLGRRILFSMPARDAELVYEEGRRLAITLEASSNTWLRHPSDISDLSGNPGRRLQVAPGL